jgi:hypothetical protein
MADQPSLPPLWKDHAKIYPPVQEIAAALQDPGKKETKKRSGKDHIITKYPQIEKLAIKIFKAIQREYRNPEGLEKNASRGKRHLIVEILVARKHIDVTEVHTIFHQFAKDGKVFLCQNDPVRCGLDHCVARYQQHINSLIQQKNNARTPNDGLRLTGILLDSTYRNEVSSIMTKKKDRKKSDVAGDPVTHFFAQILTECFLNSDYVVSPPPAQYYDQFPEEEKEKWDPNNFHIFENQERDAEWLRNTWEEYTKPKYKKALDLWNKGTGHGDGSPVNFINFCGGDRWLVYLFCKDLDANFLLANSAGGRMPVGLQVEGGFDMSSISGSDTSSKRKEIEDELEAVKKQRQDISSTISRVTNYLEARAPKNTTSEMDTYIRQVADYSQKMVDNAVLETLTPNSKSVYISAIEKERKKVLEKMKKGSDN